MEYAIMAAMAALAAVCLWLGQRLRRLEEQMLLQQQTLEKTRNRLDKQSRWEQEAIRSERLFREGLQNILNYGVK